MFFKKLRASVMRRSTLNALFAMDARQLQDMGLTHYDIAEAMRYGGAAASRLLDARRNERTAGWLR